ncbi:DNA primase [hydrothermal vent metagenome]|uniref:DNA primase n=1 Tax=hydrothermal vent metagenome TaxID=652676 RepID=A0A3B1CBP9_9ZZZZ
MGFIPDHIIDDVRIRADIVEVVSEYLPLKKAGANYRCLCPFHEEKTPSFNVNPAKQIFHCFGCGEGGNVFTFIIKHEKASFPEAVRMLAKRYGVDIPEDGGEERSGEFEKLYSVISAASDYYHAVLKNQAKSSPVWRYITKRGITPEIIEKFNLGWAPDAWDSATGHLNDKGFDNKILEKAGVSSLSSRNTYIDRFRARLMFPINNPGGKTIAFGGRLIDSDPKGAKYINSPETPIYHKSKVLFGFDLARDSARKEGKMVVVEGYMDVIALRKAGINNCVACSGAAFTPGQAELIKRICDNVVMLFDSDKAGVEAAKKGGAILLGHAMRPKALILPDAKDPDEFLASHKPEELTRLIDNSPPFLEFLIEMAVRNADLSGIDGRIAAIGQVIPYLKRVKDEVERAHYIQLLAERTRTDHDALRRQVAREWTGPEEIKKGLAPQKKRASAGMMAEKMLVRLLLNHPDLVAEAATKLETDDFSDPVLKAVFALIISNAGKHSATTPADMINLSNDENLKRFISALTMEEEMLDEKEVETMLADCMKKMRYDPQERSLRHQQMKMALKKGENEPYNEAKEKYLQSR